MKLQHLIEIAGIRIVVENGIKEIKAKVDFITKNNDQNGIIYAIKKFVSP